MKSQNTTSINEFVLLGFGDLKEVEDFLFLLFLLIYLMTMAGNILIVLLVVADRHLHTPMYFFLGNLSFLETCYSSVLLPRFLSSIFSHDKTISIQSCFVQHYFFAALGAVECYLLSVMSYDRYLAICRPLHYGTTMNGRLCMQMTITCWINGFFASTLTTSLMSRLNFCGPKEIDHFFCDSFPIINLSCSDIQIMRTIMYAAASLFTFPPFILILASYIFIIQAILRIPSTTGKEKAFSTCSSHLSVVTVFYGTAMVVYILPSTKELRKLNKAFSVVYIFLTPLLNPIIYSLRNGELKQALRRIISLVFNRTWDK